MRIVVSMVVRDELRRYQPLFARHALSWCDEIRLLDDCSVDDTGRVIRELDPDRVRLIRNERSRWDAEGEGALRQQLLDWTLAAGADWVVSLDADEVVPRGRSLRAYLEGYPGWVEVVSLRMVEVWSTRVGPTTICVGENDTIPAVPPRRWAIRVDGGWAPSQCPIAWRPPPVSMNAAEAWQQGWSIPKRRLACGRQPERVRMIEGYKSGFDVLHLGWANDEERQKRFDRYMQIDGGKYHSRAHLESIMESPTLETYQAPDLVVPCP